MLLHLLYVNGFSQYDVNSVISPNFIFETLALNKDVETAAWPKYSSPTDLKASPDKKKLYVAEQTAKTIAVIDVKEKKVEKKIQLPNEVTGLAVSPDGSRIYATCSSDLWPDGFVAEVDIAAGKVTNRIPVGHGARCPNISPDGNLLYVCNIFNNNISVVDLGSKKEKSKIQVIREPYAAALTPDGKTLVVANSLPHEVSTDSQTITNKIQLINTADGKITKTLPLPVGSHSALGVTVSPDGKYALVTHLLGMFNHVADKISGGWIHTNNMAIVDIGGQRIINDVSLDNPTFGSGNPWGVTFSEDGKYGVVAIAGKNDILVFDFQQLLEFAKNADSSLSSYLRTMGNHITNKQVYVEAKAPRTVVTIDDLIYVAGYFSDTLVTYTLDTKTSIAGRTVQDRILLQDPPKQLTSHRRGEYYFYAASLCLETWQSCHSCHPFGRPDALNWILNVVSNPPKNAKSMVYSWWTPRTNWAGKREDASQSIRVGIQEELFIQVIGEVQNMAVDMDTFFMRLKPVPSPYLVKGRLSESAQRGRAIYYDANKVNCIVCHPAPLFTDMKFHDAGFDDPLDGNKEWDTPGLNECWRTAPYNHIGSSENIRECLLSPGHANIKTLDGKMRFTEDELNDLIEYVLSL
jgi:YVTN family beta-propeller protein